MARAAKWDFDLALSNAWHGEAFARTKRLKKFSAYVGNESVEGRRAPDEVGVLTLFREMQAHGKDVKITRLN
jgi:hypothetical protein